MNARYGCLYRDDAAGEHTLVAVHWYADCPEVVNAMAVVGDSLVWEWYEEPQPGWDFLSRCGRCWGKISPNGRYDAAMDASHIEVEELRPRRAEGPEYDE